MSGFLFAQIFRRCANSESLTAVIHYAVRLSSGPALRRKKSIKKGYPFGYPLFNRTLLQLKISN